MAFALAWGNMSSVYFIDLFYWWNSNTGYDQGAYIRELWPSCKYRPKCLQLNIYGCVPMFKKGITQRKPISWWKLKHWAHWNITCLISCIKWGRSPNPHKVCQDSSHELVLGQVQRWLKEKINEIKNHHRNISFSLNEHFVWQSCQSLHIQSESHITLL